MKSVKPAELERQTRLDPAVRLILLTGPDEATMAAVAGHLIGLAGKEAERLDGWVQEAIGKGADLLCGGKREGAMLEATLLENVDPKTKLNIEEAFGPVAFLIRFSEWNEAVKIVNDSKFGIHAGVFTRDVFKVFDAWDNLDVGGVVVNDVPSYRVDNMPYGGVKDSGIGREGVKFAMEDMTEIRNLVIRRRNV